MKKEVYVCNLCESVDGSFEGSIDGLTLYEGNTFVYVEKRDTDIHLCSECYKALIPLFRGSKKVFDKTSPTK